MLIAALIFAASACLASAVEAADRLRIAVQKTGTAAWEIEVMKAHGLDKAANLDIETTELASTEAGKIALEGGAVDMMIGDWLWAARERALGDKLLFTPYSTALGAVMAPKDSQIHSVADLAGKSIGVAGGPIDKSWLMLRAAALAAGATCQSGAPVLRGAAARRRETCPGRDRDGARILEFLPPISRGAASAGRSKWPTSRRRSGRQGPVAMIGYVFSEAFAASHKDALKRFFAAAAQARRMMAEDPAAWAPIKARMRLKDDAAFGVYRERYLEGLPKRSVAEEAADARVLYRRLAEIGGEQLVGKAKELDAGLFYDPAASE